MSPLEASAPAAPSQEKPRRIWTFMYALGGRGPPPRALVSGRLLTLERVVKHDFWAATAFYLDDAGKRIVVKFGRSHPFLGLPAHPAGRWLVRRESHFYARLADLPLVPQWLGFVEDGPPGFAHAYVPGRPMSEAPADRLEAGFFRELAEVLAAMHARGIAYVDLHKPQNVIVGEHDGRPYLIDFQISYDSRQWRGLPAVLRRAILRVAARADRYHLLKHKRRRRPDLLTPAEIDSARRPTRLIRIHRFLFRPYYFVRRRLLGHLRRTGRVLPEMSR